MRNRKSFFTTLLVAPPWTRTRIIFFQFCVVLPLLGYFGLWNPYLSFSVYSGASAHGYAFFQQRALLNLPPPILSAISPSQGELYELAFDRWAAATLFSPPSPQLEDMHKIATSLCRTLPNAENDVIFIIRAPARPWERKGSDSAYGCQRGGLISIE